MILVVLPCMGLLSMFPSVRRRAHHLVPTRAKDHTRAHLKASTRALLKASTRAHPMACLQEVPCCLGPTYHACPYPGLATPLERASTSERLLPWQAWEARAPSLGPHRRPVGPRSPLGPLGNLLWTFLHCWGA